MCNGSTVYQCVFVLCIRFWGTECRQGLWGSSGCTVIMWSVMYSVCSAKAC